MRARDAQGRDIEFIDGAWRPVGPMQQVQEEDLGRKVDALVAEGKAPLLGPKMSAMLQGTTAGFGDELTSGLRAEARQPTTLFSQGLERTGNPDIDALAQESYGRAAGAQQREYESLLGAERKQLKDFEEDRPLTSLGLNVAGGAPLGAFGMPNMLARLPAVGSLFSKAPRLAGAAETGALAGAVAGAGTTEGGPLDRAQGAAVGAGLGAVAAPVAVGAAVGGGKAVNYLRNILNLGSVTQMADDKIIQAIMRSDTTPEALVTKIDQLQKLGAKPEAIFDLPEVQNLVDLARSAQRAPSGGRSTGAKFLYNRAKEAGDRVSEDVGRLVTNNPSGGAFDPYTVLKQVSQNRFKKAEPLYAEVRAAGPLWNDDLADFMKRPAVKEAYESLRLNAANEGKPFQEIFDEAGDAVNPPTLDTWERVKREIGTALNKHRDPTTGILRTEGRQDLQALQKLQRDLAEKLEKADPTGKLKQARAAWAGESENEEAFRLGMDALKMSKAQIDDLSRDMSEAEKDFLKLGLASHIKEQVAKKRDSHDMVSWLTDTKQNREVLEKVFDKPGEYEKFMSQLAREQRMHSSRQRIVGGSPTADITADLKDQDAVPGLFSNLLSGDVVGAGKAAAGHVLSKGRDAMSARQASRIADRLFESDPNKNKEMLRQLQERIEQLTRREGVMDRAVIAPIGAGVGIGRGLEAE